MEEFPMRRRIKAVYQGGALRPLEPLSLSEDARVVVTVEPEATGKAADVLGLAAQVYRGLDDRDIAEVEAIALDRCRFFRDPV